MHSPSLLDLVSPPPIPGLAIRPFSADDYPGLISLLNEICAFEGITPCFDVATFRLMERWDPDFDPLRDRVLLEVDGDLIGAATVGTSNEPDGSRIYSHSCHLHPRWRGEGIERPILQHNERRLHQIARKYPGDTARTLRAAHVAESNPHAGATLQQAGYLPVRYSFHMIRPTLEDIHDAVLPDSLVARPIQEHELRAIWDANIEAFRDHWGYQDPPPNGFDLWTRNPALSRSLSRIAWDGDQVAGMVLIYLPPEEQQHPGQRCADTEQICVRRPWRKRGIATALIAQCLHALKSAGFQQAALGVDSQNLSGALRIYERMGYQVKQRYTLFQRAMGDTVPASS